MKVDNVKFDSARRIASTTRGHSAHTDDDEDDEKTPGAMISCITFASAHVLAEFADGALVVTAIKEQLGKLTAARAKLADSLKAVASDDTLDAAAKVASDDVHSTRLLSRLNGLAANVHITGHAHRRVERRNQKRNARFVRACARVGTTCLLTLWVACFFAVLFMHGLFEILKRGIALLEKEADQIVGSSVNLSIAIDGESGTSSADANVAIPNEPKDALQRLAALRGFLRAKMRSFRKSVAGLVANLHLVAEPFANDKVLVEAIKTITAVTETEMSIDNSTGNEILDQNYELIDFVVLVWLVHA